MYQENYDQYFIKNQIIYLLERNLFREDVLYTKKKELWCDKYAPEIMNEVYSFL